MKTAQIVSPREWDAARERLLVREKELTRARDAMATQSRRMPWMRVEQDYSFDGPNGTARLLDLFEGSPPAGRLPRLLRTGSRDLRRGRRVPGGPQTRPYQWWNYHDAYGPGG